MHIMKLYRFVNWKKRTIALQERPIYEPLFEKSIDDVKEDWNIVDAGAQVGYYTIPMANKARKGKVYAYECHPDIVKVLQKNIRLHKLNNVEIIPKALSGKCGEKIEMWGSDSAGGTRVGKDKNLISILGAFRRRLLGIERSGGIVETDTIDALVSRKSIKINMIKMDIQGMEYEALLKGTVNVLRTDKPLLLIEVHRQRTWNQEDLLHALKNVGYNLTTERRSTNTIWVKGVASQL